MKMLFRFGLPALLSAALVVPALAQYPLAWSSFRNLGQHAEEQPNKILNAPGGGYFVYGSTGGGSQVLMKLDGTGGMLWNRLRPGAPGDMAANSTGVAFVGLGPRSGGGSMLVAKYDTAGTLLWTRQLALTTSSYFHVKMAMDASGNVVVAATTGDYPDTNVIVVKFIAATGGTVFNKGFGTASTMDQMASLRIDSSGSIFLTATTNPADVNSVALIKYNTIGTVLWSKTSAGTNPDVQVDGAGNSYFIQHTATQIQVTKYDSNGSVVWNPLTNADAYTSSSTITPAGAIVVVTSSNSGDMTVSKFSAAGAFQWTKSSPDYASGSLLHASVSADASDNIYIVGSTTTNPNDAALVKFDSAGNFGWAKTEGGSMLYNDAGVSGIVDPAGHAVWVSRVTNVLPAMADIRCASYDSAGNRLWGNDIDLSKSGTQNIGAVTDAAGNTYMEGSSAVFAGFYSVINYVVVKFNASGGVLWTHGIGAIAGQNSNLMAPQLAPGGGVVLFQRGLQNVGMRGAVYRYDANGTLLWTYNSFPGREWVTDYKVGSDGSVYFAMRIGTDNGVGGFNNNLRMMKLNANGTLAWTADKTGGVSDSPNALALDSAGNAYMNYQYKGVVADTWQMALAKFNTNGTFGWAVDTGPATTNFFEAGLAVDPSGNVLDYVQLANAVNQFKNDQWIYKYDANGNMLWHTQLFTTGFISNDSQVYVDSLGNSFVWASLSLNNVQTGAISRLDSSGAVSWTTQFPLFPTPPGDNIAPDNLGGAAVGTSIRGANGIDFEVVKFAPNGAFAWPATGGGFVNGTLLSDAFGLDNRQATLTSDSSGNLYVSGTGYSPAGTFDLNLVKYMGSDSALANQFVSSSMVAGQTYQVAFTFKNTGFETWTNGAGDRMITLNSSTWGIGTVLLGNSEKIAPGQSRAFYFYVNAPMVGGTYNLQCKMYKNGLGSFGALSANASVVVTVNADAARNLSITVPTTVKAGTTFSVTVDMRNVGTNTWTQTGGYLLAPVPGFPNWSVSQVALGPSDSIAPTSHKVFTFQCTVPATAGSYTMSWQLRHLATFFGDKTISKTIVVTP